MLDLSSPQGSIPCTLQWKHQVLATGPPWNSLQRSFFKIWSLHRVQALAHGCIFWGPPFNILLLSPFYRWENGDGQSPSIWLNLIQPARREGVCKLRQSVPKPGLTTIIPVKEKGELNSCFNGFSLLVEKVKTNKQISGYITASGRAVKRNQAE